MRLEKIGRAIVMRSADNGCGVVLLKECGGGGFVIMGETTEAEVEGGVSVFGQFVLPDKEDGALPAIHASCPDLYHIGIGIPAFLLRCVHCLETDSIEVVAAAVV